MRHLLTLLARNREAARAARPSAVIASSGDSATVYLYGAIVSSAIEAEYWGGVAAESFVPELAALKASTIHLRIDSPGGDVFGGQAIAQALREHPATVVAHVDGVAASAATVVATAADQVVMAEGALYMVHRAWTVAFGNKNELLDTAALLEKVDATLAAQYASKTGMSVEKALTLMDDETWMNAEEAVAQGFADRVYAPEKDSKKTQARWDLSAYLKAPEQEPAPTPVSASHRDWQVRQLRLPRH